MKYKVIKAFPLGPPVGTIIDSMDAINLVAHCGLLIYEEDVKKFPEFFAPYIQTINIYDGDGIVKYDVYKGDTVTFQTFLNSEIITSYKINFQC